MAGFKEVSHNRFKQDDDWKMRAGFRMNLYTFSPPEKQSNPVDELLRRIEFMAYDSYSPRTEDNMLLLVRNTTYCYTLPKIINSTKEDGFDLQTRDTPNSHINYSLSELHFDSFSKALLFLKRLGAKAPEQKSPTFTSFYKALNKLDQQTLEQTPLHFKGIPEITAEVFKSYDAFFGKRVWSVEISLSLEGLRDVIAAHPKLLTPTSWDSPLRQNQADLN